MEKEKIDKPEKIRVLITHSHKFYKSGQRYSVWKDVVVGHFELVSKPLRFISILHAKQIPNK